MLAILPPSPSSPYDNSKVAFTPGGSMAYKSGSSSKMLYKINVPFFIVVDLFFSHSFYQSANAIPFCWVSLSFEEPNNFSIALHIFAV